MAEFRRTPLRPRPDRDWLPTAGLALTGILVLAIVKPWDAFPATTVADPTAQPTFFVRPTERTGPRDYDPRLFGAREPDPAWELWPAGYVVQFGLAGPVRVTGQGEPTGGPGPTSEGSPPPAASVRPGASAAASAPVGTGSPVIEHVVDLGPADHLVALGINTPLDAQVASFRLLRRTDDRTELVPVIRLPTLWESAHFIVIAPEDPVAAGQPAQWTAGAYRLELTTVFGELRVVDLEIRPPLE
jgi:hypothetical protein